MIAEGRDENYYVRSGLHEAETFAKTLARGRPGTHFMVWESAGGFIVDEQSGELPGIIQKLRDAVGALGGLDKLRPICPELANSLADNYNYIELLGTTQ